MHHVKRMSIQKAQIENVFRRNSGLFQEAGVEERDVLPEELLEYFAGNTPTGDVTTLDDVISNRWLLLHEVVELKHLKLKGIIITRDVLWDRYVDVLEAHIAATAVELKMALKYDDKDWIRSRVKLIPSWLEDPEMPENLRAACKKLMEHYTL